MGYSALLSAEVWESAVQVQFVLLALFGELFQNPSEAEESTLGRAGRAGTANSRGSEGINTFIYLS